MEATLKILALFVIVGTFLPLIRCDSWVVRGFDFPRIQMLILGLAVLIGLSLLGFRSGVDFIDCVVIGLLGISIISIAVWMWRYTPLHPKEVMAGDSGASVCFLVSNVLMSNRESDKLVALVRDLEPDIFVALETDQWWAEGIAELSSEYPHAVELPQEDTYGMVMRSRIPLIDPKVEYIVRKNIPSIHTEIEISGGVRVKLHAVHPKPPFPDEEESSIDRDAELLAIAKRIKGTTAPTVVLGDLNDVAWSRTTRLFQKISGLLDPRVGRGFFSTFHAGHWFLRWPLDHIFVSDHFRVSVLNRLSSVGSDHFPLFTVLSYEPSKKHEQEAPESDAGDVHAVNEEIEDAEKKNDHSIS